MHVSISRWHRVAWSVYNENVQMYVDCKMVSDKHLPRDMSNRLDLGGVVMMGNGVGEDMEVFEVNLSKIVGLSLLSSIS